MRYKAAALSFILFPTNKMNISLEICISEKSPLAAYMESLFFAYSEFKKTSLTGHYAIKLALSQKIALIALCIFHT